MDIKEIKYDFIKRERLFLTTQEQFLILLVVFGHMLQPYTSGDKYLSALYLVIYSFHMPTFLFISGYFCENIDKPYYLEKFQNA